MYNIIESPFMVEQFRFPKSRKKRIRNKWAKRPENWRPNLKTTYIIGNNIFAHPVLAQKLREKINNL